MLTRFAASSIRTAAADDESAEKEEFGEDYNEGMEDFAFGAVSRVYGDSGLKALRAARVAVVGLGGVGSYAVEVGRQGGSRTRFVRLYATCAQQTKAHQKEIG